MKPINPDIMKTCPQCRKENPEGGKFCLEDGTGLVDKLADPASGSAMSGGKILSGGDVTQTVSHHTEAKVHHQDETRHWSSHWKI